MLLKLLCVIGILNKQRFLRNLAKIEYGNSIFLEKLSKKAEQQGHLEFSQALIKHSKEENKHGIMLASLADGTNRISRSGNGRWIKILRSGNNIVKNLISFNNKPKIIQWNSSKYPGEKLIGMLESFDGMSFRYISARLLFKNISASDYSIPDQLAFMIILEKEVNLLYQELAKTNNLALRTILNLILDDEINHVNYLEKWLNYFSQTPQELTTHWNNRVKLAKWGLVIDAILFLNTKY